LFYMISLFTDHLGRDLTNPFFLFLFFFSSRRRHTRSKRDWSSDVCSSDLKVVFGFMGSPSGQVGFWNRAIRRISSGCKKRGTPTQMVYRVPSFLSVVIPLRATLA